MVVFHEVGFIPPFEWAFPSRAKSRVDERRPIAFKRVFSTLNNTLGIEFHEVGFIPPF